MTCGSPSAVQVIPLKNNLKIIVKEKFVKLISLFFRGLGQILASHFQQGGASPQEKQIPNLTPWSREGVKKSHFHPHPDPPPSRGREFLLDFQYVSPLPWRERVG
jgi:hypothetical protein